MGGELCDLPVQEKILCLNICKYGVRQKWKLARSDSFVDLEFTIKALWETPLFYFYKTSQLKSWFIFESSRILLKCPSFPGEYMIISVLIVSMLPNSETRGGDSTRKPQLWQGVKNAGSQVLPLQVSTLRASRGITSKHVTHCCWITDVFPICRKP